MAADRDLADCGHGKLTCCRGALRDPCRHRRTRLHRSGYEAGPSFDGPSAYDELGRQWASNDQALNPSGRPGPELVATAIADAIEQPATPMRVGVGDDAALVLSARRSMDDETFEATMRSVIGLTW